LVHAAALLGDNVRLRRDRRDLTQQEAAERASIEVKHWQLIEAGGTNPTLATLLALAKALDIEVHELLRFKTPQSRARRSR
jgi:transcriptional regulator with XRE-family HTH domain